MSDERQYPIVRAAADVLDELPYDIPTGAKCAQVQLAAHTPRVMLGREDADALMRQLDELVNPWLPAGVVPGYGDYWMECDAMRRAELAPMHVHMGDGGTLMFRHKRGSWPKWAHRTDGLFGPTEMQSVVSVRGMRFRPRWTPKGPA